MSKETISRVLVAAIVLFAVSSLCASAQNGAYSGYSPYNIYGIGDVSNHGAAYQRSMGGVGIAGRSNRFVNYLNPASVTSRDSLEVMSSYGLTESNVIYAQDGNYSAKNIFNINNISFSLPLSRKVAVMFGINPYSTTGYKYKSTTADKGYSAVTGAATNASQGQGSIYELFFGIGYQPFKNFSIGAEAMYLSGDINKTSSLTFTNSSTYSQGTETDIVPSGMTAKVGAQYEIPISKTSGVTLGATYRFSTKMSGLMNNYTSYTGPLATETDTLAVNLTKDGGVRYGSEIGAGIGVKVSNRLNFEIDYIYSDWTNSGFDSVTGLGVKGLNQTFTSSTAQSVRAGFEFVPNRNDIRYYFKSCEYRAGAFYDESYYRINGYPVRSYGLTFGMTLPVFRWYNSVSLGMELGRRSTFQTGMVSENFINFTVGFNACGFWFQKRVYD